MTNYITPETIAISQNHLEITLANLTILYFTARNIHWNVQGSNFIALHKFFEDIYNDIAEYIDQTAEHLRALNLPASTSLTHYQKTATISSQEKTLSVVAEALSTIGQQYKDVVSALHTAIDCTENDPIRQDYFTGLAVSLEKTLRLITSHIV